MDRYIGEMLDNRYEILEVIGTGGMAVVYKAKCHRLNRLVAVKILKDEFSRDEEFRRRFQAESQAVAMLSHPNIVSVYDVSKSGDTDYIVMELIDGITLKQYMDKKGVLNWRETLHFATQIAKALEHAHSRGIIHRDIKPHNIMILRNGSVKVADFGIARITSAQSTLTREALGSVHYISPEQAKGGRVDNRTDLYSLGVIMYEMLAGQPPYDGDSPVAVAIQHINAEAPMPSTINPSIPGGLEQITMHAMCADLDRRYASATEMLYDLEEFRKDPDIIFAFDGAASAAVPRPRTVAEQHAAQRPPQRPVQQSTAQKQPQQRSEAQRRAAERARRQREEEARRKAKKKKVTTIAIVVAAILVVVGLVIAVATSCGADEELVKVPNFEGMVYEEINPADYPDFELVMGESEYNDEVEEGKVISQKPGADKQVAKGTKIELKVSLGPQTGDMPALKNQLRNNAKKLLEALDMDLTILFDEEFSDDVEEGRVTRTDPKAGDALENGQVVTIYLSKGPEEVLVKVPKLVDLTEEQATKKLDDMKLDYYISRIDSDVDKGRVITQSIDAGEEVKEGTLITLTVSNGPKETESTTPPETTTTPQQPEPSGVRRKTVSVSFDASAEPRTVTIYAASGALITEQELPANETAVNVSLEGSGTVSYEIYVNGAFYKEISVNFNE